MQRERQRLEEQRQREEDLAKQKSKQIAATAGKKEKPTLPSPPPSILENKNIKVTTGNTPSSHHFRIHPPTHWILIPFQTDPSAVRPSSPSNSVIMVAELKNDSPISSPVIGLTPDGSPSASPALSR